MANQLEREAFSAKLRDHLKSKGWNQSQLARYAGLNRDQISSYTRSKSIPTTTSLNKLCKALGVSAEDLLPGSADASAVDPSFEIRAIPGVTDAMWVRVNMKLPKPIANQIFALINDVDTDH